MQEPNKTKPILKVVVSLSTLLSGETKSSEQDSDLIKSNIEAIRQGYQKHLQGEYLVVVVPTKKELDSPILEVLSSIPKPILQVIIAPIARNFSETDESYKQRFEQYIKESENEVKDVVGDEYHVIVIVSQEPISCPQLIVTGVLQIGHEYKDIDIQQIANKLEDING